MATTLPEHRETLLRLAEAWIKVAQEAAHSRSSVRQRTAGPPRSHPTPNPSGD